MDVNKVMSAINEFQNAMDRNRTFLAMQQKAAELWTELGNINPAELQSLADLKDKLSTEVAALTEQRNTLKEEVANVANDKQTKADALERQIQQRKEAADAEHAAVIERMRNEVTALQLERENLQNSHEQVSGQMRSERDQLQTQLNSLKSQLQSMLHA